MGIFWGTVVIILSLLAWGGQAISWVVPETAVRWNLMEAEDSVEPVYWADIRGEALWDLLSLWIMVVAGALLIADQPPWAYFGLVGGGVYVYFAGRGIVTRVAMQRRGHRIGATQNVTLGYVLLAMWGVMGLVTIVAAVVSLPTS
jgi:hypothetical protein